MNQMMRVINKTPVAKKERSISRVQKTKGFQPESSAIARILFLQRTIGNQAIQKLIKSGALKTKLKISQPGDKYEQEADRVADAVMRMPEPVEHLIQKKCPGCEEEELKRQPIEEEEEEELQKQPVEVNLMTKTDNTPEILYDIESGIQALRGGGRPLPESMRTFFEPRFGKDFSKVRVHTDTQAAESARALNARAFTVGQDVVFGNGEYSPGTREGRWLLAHELTHVIQQKAKSPSNTSSQEVKQASSDPMVQFDLAVTPPSPEAVPRAFTEEEIQEAIRYNAFRFKDPYSISVVRDVVGIPKYPAVSDRDLVLAIARWQAQFNLTVDGKAGPAVTRTLVRELNAEGLPPLGRQLRQDNFITWNNVNGPARTPCSATAPGRFQWDVNFNTSLRNGWLIQRLDNTWNVENCNGTPNNADVVTGRYWEAWWVNGDGNVFIPTTLANPPATAVPAIAHDLWRRPCRPSTRGTWSMNARLYTTLDLPPGFAFNTVPDAVDLPSTTAAPNSDNLGLEVASRRQGGEWDCCDPDPARHFHRSA